MKIVKDVYYPQELYQKIHHQKYPYFTLFDDGKETCKIAMNSARINSLLTPELKDNLKILTYFSKKKINQVVRDIFEQYFATHHEMVNNYKVLCLEDVDLYESSKKIYSNENPND